MIDPTNDSHIKWHEEHYRASDINDKLIINLRDLSHVMRSMYEGKGSQKRILMILDELGGSTAQNILTRRLEIKPGSASEVIAKLEASGYVVRTQSEADRRGVNVELTELGKAAAREARETRKQRHERMFSCLTSDEKDELLSLFEKLNKDWRVNFREDGSSHDECGHHGHHGHCENREHHGPGEHSHHEQKLREGENG